MVRSASLCRLGVLAKLTNHTLCFMSNVDRPTGSRMARPQQASRRQGHQTILPVGSRARSYYWVRWSLSNFEMCARTAG
jgi:hypothetical protein